MNNSFKKPNFTPTMMAAVPYRDMDRAADVILKCFPEAPCLPIMTRSLRWMFEGIPCLIIDREKKQVLMSPPEERESEVIEFYERVEKDDLDYFATTPQTAPFFHEMIDRLSQSDASDLKWVIFRTVGPVVLGDTIKQVNGNPSIHHETLFDIIVKSVSMKARWLEKKIREVLPGVDVIADQPEPSLVGFTSAGGTGSRDDVIDAVNGGFAGLTCLKWVHCCANIDWSLLTDANIDIINFDAYRYADKAALHGGGFKKFIEGGGMIGWGIVPVVEDLLLRENVKSLSDKLKKGMELFASSGIDETLLASASWVLPSCETILLTPEQSDRAFEMTQEISYIMKDHYGFNRPAH
ncbi:MAG: hypothetical protein JRJ39_09785 [Deltaproteobacteria bacterium]|nr:hypothetical protein [Deltaproteobacteria bacterium]MBW1813938.1 hypothetical protein [Deltaproteobacteria bacterium]MBW1848259.1 hypothetical protein [Deltaproteobacteria bacterium]MBW1983328.1 hypothetical protein [Deltaproteobacteria bacterium]MBW2181890.1 hypothetical protein [Deltaproteobacteria bacterium]